MLSTMSATMSATISDMEKAIKIAQIQTGVESSGADDTVSKALFAHSFPGSVPKN